MTRSASVRGSKLSTLGIALDLPPMEARLVADLPAGDGWQYEPKWDGFRCLAFRHGSEVEIKAKSGKSLTRFFPEVVANVEARYRPWCFHQVVVIARQCAAAFRIAACKMAAPLAIVLRQIRARLRA
jgi:ATP-dependent DNA ligase